MRCTHRARGDREEKTACLRVTRTHTHEMVRPVERSDAELLLTHPTFLNPSARSKGDRQRVGERYVAMEGTVVLVVVFHRYW
jgi:hypothetical protein